MSIHLVSTGNKCPDEFNVVIEIPMGGEPIKYEVDKESGQLFVDRLMSAAMHYPCNYGYIPRTLCGDGDPVDVLVYMTRPLMPACVITCRPIGVLKMEDESGEDAKIIALPADSVTQYYSDITSIKQLSKIRLDRIAHFFEHYKDLEEGKWVKLNGWEDVDAAKQEIVDSVNRYNKKEGK